MRELLGELGERGLKVVLASSGAPDQVDVHLDLFDGRKLADAWTTSEDVGSTKPAPDLISVAMERVEGTHGVMIGDSVWDLAAAGRAGQVGYAIRTGGFSTEELTEAGARGVFDSVPDLHQALDRVLGES